MMEPIRYEKQTVKTGEYSSTSISEVNEKLAAIYIDYLGQLTDEEKRAFRTIFSVLTIVSVDLVIPESCSEGDE